MIANPIDAMFNARTIDSLTTVMTDIFRGVMTKKGGDAYLKVDWVIWATKYNDVHTAKKCAIAMYHRVKGV
jgi:hypothetical protein